MTVLLLITGLILAATTVVLAGWAIALPWIRARDRLLEVDSYGFATDTGASGGIETAMDRIAQRLGDRFDPDDEEKGGLRDLLMSAGMYGTNPTTLFGHRLLTAILVPATWLWLATTLLGASAGLMVLGLVPAAFGGWKLPIKIVRLRAQRRHERIDRELPELIDSLIVTVEAGMGFNAALRLASGHIGGPLGDEVGLALHEQDIGRSTEASLRGMVERADTPSMHSFTRAILQGEMLGVSIGQSMRGLAVEMRARRRAAAEEKAQKAPVKMLFPLIFLIFPSIFIVLLYPAVANFSNALGGG